MDKQEYQARVAWLRRYRDAVHKRQNLVLRMHEAKDAAVHISPALSSVRSQSRDGVSAAERAVERIEDARARLLEQELACKALYAEIMRAIMVLPDAKGREVLRRRYLWGQPMQAIAREMGISLRWVKHLHRAAVENIKTHDLTLSP